ncbi:hypothetical protein AAFF_G00219150 [Aldrovandia affinis]|uniref:Uncharacterized protein n=1 Tax=Aldrovandia affinis TaxID=143900 RepID=A0AAD7WUD9_9TELE|nr:hypothetical protein AAFF_G00219150 [Aldrovandia affinis]
MRVKSHCLPPHSLINAGRTPATSARSSTRAEERTLVNHLLLDRWHHRRSPDHERGSKSLFCAIRGLSGDGDPGRRRPHAAAVFVSSVLKAPGVQVSFQIKAIRTAAVEVPGGQPHTKWPHDPENTRLHPHRVVLRTLPEKRAWLPQRDAAADCFSRSPSCPAPGAVLKCIGGL